MAKHLLTMAILLLLVFPAAAFSEEAPAGAPAAGGAYEGMADWAFPPAQHFAMKQYIDLFHGYRFTGFDGFKEASLRAAEFDYLHDSPAGGLELHYYPDPWLIDVDAQYKNRYDHDAGVRLYYKDILKIDYINTALFHNQDHYQVNFIGGNDPDPAQRFGVAVDSHDLTLTLKDPGRPYRVYVNMHNFSKWGQTQARFLFLESRPREINWTTNELTAGASLNVINLFEIDYHHTIKEFNSNDNSFLVNDGFFFGNPLAHNLIANLETNENVIQVHTDMRRPLAGAATVSWGDKRNPFSGSKATFDREYGDVTYRIMDNMFAAVKYGHQNLVVRNDQSVLAPEPFSAIHPMTIDKDSISTSRDRGTASITYYPLPKLMLLAKYDLDSVSRTNAKDWTSEAFLNVTKSGSITHRGTVSATYSPMAHTKLRAGYSFAYTGDPSRNTDQMRAHEAWIFANCVPSPGLALDAHYKLFRGDNPGRSQFTNDFTPDELDRHTVKDNAGAGVSWYAVPGLVLGANYAYIRTKITTNLLFNSEILSQHSPSWDVNHTYDAYAKYCFSFPLELQADFSQDWSKGQWRPEIPFGGDSLGAVTDQKIRETKGCIKADYEVYKGWGTRFTYAISEFSDLAMKEVTGLRSGIAMSGVAMLTKVW